MTLITVLSKFNSKDKKELDVADKLIYITTPLMIAISILISLKQFSNSPIECITPDHFSQSMKEYAESYCWTEVI
jgi:hypothetical protein